MITVSLCSMVAPSLSPFCFVDLRVREDHPSEPLPFSQTLQLELLHNGIECAAQVSEQANAHVWAGNCASDLVRPFEARHDITGLAKLGLTDEAYEYHAALLLR